MDIQQSNSSMTAEHWLFKATVFEIGTCIFHKRMVRIEARDQMDDTRLWVVKMDEWVLGKDKEWHWEPLPSSRTDEFIANTRFKSFQEAFYFWRDSVTEATQLNVNQNKQ